MLLDKASSKGKFALKILAVFLICAADMLFAAWVIYAEKQKGTLLSVRAASSYLPQLFAQNLLTSAVPAFLVFLALVFCKKRFVQAMQLTVPKGKTRKIAVLLLFLLLIVTAAALIVKPDKITVLYSLFYYTVFIAFCEEFVVRGVCVGFCGTSPPPFATSCQTFSLPPCTCSPMRISERSPRLTLCVLYAHKWRGLSPWAAFSNTSKKNPAPCGSPSSCTPF